MDKWLKIKIEQFNQTNESLLSFVSKQHKKTKQPYSGNTKYSMYKKMLPFVNPARTINDGNVSKYFGRRRTNKRANVQSLMKVVQHCYTQTLDTDNLSDLYTRFAIIILTCTNIPCTKIHMITNKVWDLFDQYTTITMPQLTVTIHQFLYAIAKSFIPIGVPGNDPNAPIVQISTSMLNKKFKDLYLQINFDEPNVGSLGLRTLEKLNKNALYEHLRTYSIKLVEAIHNDSVDRARVYELDVDTTGKMTLLNSTVNRRINGITPNNVVAQPIILTNEPLAFSQSTSTAQQQQELRTSIWQQPLTRDPLRLTYPTPDTQDTIKVEDIKSEPFPID